MTHPNPILPAQVIGEHTSHYSLWDREMFVTVTQHTGAHGFYSAAMVVERCDDPIECLVYEGYSNDVPRHLADIVMRNWIAAKLNMLATGTHSAVGTFCNVVAVMPEY